MADALTQSLDRALTALDGVILGKPQQLRLCVACLLSRGHLLIEDVPGVGKTTLAHALAQVFGLGWNRVQFTSDLLPADIIGVSVFDRGSQQFEFRKGPVFTQLLLADEVNRATPKTQSALLEAMAERHVTVGGVTRPLPKPFFVMATQNPIEMEGTYPLPEAQLDRFLAKVLVGLPEPGELVEILERTTGTATEAVSPVATADELVASARLVREVPIASHVTRHAVDLVQASHPRDASAPEPVRRYVRHGASPRGAQSLVLLAKTYALLDGRLQAGIDDVRTAAWPCLRHRLVLGYEALAAGVAADDLVAALLDEVVVPKPPVKGAI
jgi:MoxR-like ATPase